jgi:hypothetical protein
MRTRNNVTSRCSVADEKGRHSLSRNRALFGSCIDCGIAVAHFSGLRKVGWVPFVFSLSCCSASMWEGGLIGIQTPNSRSLVERALRAYEHVFFVDVDIAGSARAPGVDRASELVARGHRPVMPRWLVGLAECTPVFAMGP